MCSSGYWGWESMIKGPTKSSSGGFFLTWTKCQLFIVFLMADRRWSFFSPSMRAWIVSKRTAPPGPSCLPKVPMPMSITVDFIRGFDEMKVETGGSLGLAVLSAHPTWQVSDQWETLSQKQGGQPPRSNTQGWLLTSTCVHMTVHLHLYRSVYPQSHTKQMHPIINKEKLFIKNKIGLKCETQRKDTTLVFLPGTYALVGTHFHQSLKFLRLKWLYQKNRKITVGNQQTLVSHWSSDDYIIYSVWYTGVEYIISGAFLPKLP